MKQFVIIGNSAAGIASAEAIRNKDKDSKILIVSDEDTPAYCRSLIPYYLAGQMSKDSLVYRRESFYKDNNIELITNKKVTKVSPKKNRISLEDKTQIDYDSLLIATGARSELPKLPGVKKKNIFALRNIKDAEDIVDSIPLTQVVCILGAGPTGLKIAEILKKRSQDIEVKVFTESTQVLPNSLDSQAALLIQKELEKNALDIGFQQSASEMIGDGELKALKLKSGKVIGCSLIIFDQGTCANIDLVKDTEIKVNQGIVVNEFLQSSIPNIFAAGDVCDGFDALWPNAVNQGRIAGANLLGEKFSYPGSLNIGCFNFYGLAAVSLGKVNNENKDSSLKELSTLDQKQSLYKKIVLKDGVIQGVILVGDICNSGVFLNLIRRKANVSKIEDRLLKENFSYADTVK